MTLLGVTKKPDDDDSSDKEKEPAEEEETQSVLQAKLSKLAIQLGYAGERTKKKKQSKKIQKIVFFLSIMLSLHLPALF